jgi:hypothetical protein
LKGIQQRVFIHQFATGSVDKPCTLFHRGELLLSEEALRLIG